MAFIYVVWLPMVLVVWYFTSYASALMIIGRAEAAIAYNLVSIDVWSSSDELRNYIIDTVNSSLGTNWKYLRDCVSHCTRKASLTNYFKPVIP